MDHVPVLLLALTGFVHVSLGRVVGGHTAEEGQFPYQVSLRQNSRHFCGASILNQNWVVTAAHCMRSISDKATVVVGTNSLASGGDSYSITSALYHPQFDPSRLTYDVALVKVAKPISFSQRVQSISLNTASIGNGTSLTLSGWGLTSFPGRMPERLQFAVLQSIEGTACSKGLKTPILDSQLCTFTRAGQGACQGDSGGPLVYGGSLAGIVSWGNPCARGLPDVFTRVSSFTAWLESIMADN